MQRLYARRLLQVSLVGLLVIPLAAAGAPSFELPAKPKNNVKQWRTLPEPTPLVANEGSLNPGATQSPGHNILVNQDFNLRPQNETSIAVDPDDPKHIVTGYNDYRAGAPIGGGFSTSWDGGKSWHDGLLTHPLLVAPGDFPGFAEPAIGTGDNAVAFSRKHKSVSQATIVFSASFCENGILSHNSFDGGKSWRRPIIASNTRVVDYWPYAFDCSVFLDKEYIAADNTGGPYDGRLYVTYTRFQFAGGTDYLESPIYLAYSDNGGETWTGVGEISGASPSLCEYQTDTTGGSGTGATGADVTGACDENQFSYPVVGKDGTVYVHFLNSQNESEWAPTGDFDSQILVTKWNPATAAVSGPYRVSMVADGLSNYPTAGGRQTVCNGGWRLNPAGNIAIGPNDDLYVTWSDNRNGSTFVYPTVLGPGGSCPAGKQTSTDIFFSKSTNGGVTWSPPVRVSSDPQNSDNWFPWVAVSKKGTVGIVYYDRRVSGNNTLTDAWIALSSDGGRTWKESRVSEASSNFRTAFSGGSSFIGDYNGLAFAGEAALPFWTQGVGNDSDVWMDIVQPGGK